MYLRAKILILSIFILTLQMLVVLACQNVEKANQRLYEDTR